MCTKFISQKCQASPRPRAGHTFFFRGVSFCAQMRCFIWLRREPLNLQNEPRAAAPPTTHHAASCWPRFSSPLMNCGTRTLTFWVDLDRQSPMCPEKVAMGLCVASAKRRPFCPSSWDVPGGPQISVDSASLLLQSLKTLTCANPAHTPA